MEQVSIGSSPLKIAPIAFGGNALGWTINEQDSFKILDAFLDKGFNCIDTADVYSNWGEGLKGGESETVLGNWFAQGGGRREKTVLATKVGLEMAPGEKGLSFAYIERAVEASLRRLKTDYIDLYFSHWDDQETPLEDTLAAYGKLIKAGKVRAIGASNYSAERLTKALEISAANDLPRYECLQTLYNLYDRGGYEDSLQAVCEKNGLGVLPYFALASGFLAGKYRKESDFEGQARGLFTKRYLDDRGERILSAMDKVAADRGYTHSQIALAWLLAKPSVTAPVASGSTLEQLDQLAGAVDTRLTAEEVAQLDAASEAEPVTA